MALPVGVLGFIVTIGITFYDLRNTQFYNAAFERAKKLEVLLGFPILTSGKAAGGLFNERPRRELKFFGLVTIWHDRGLALVYGAALGAWVYIIAMAALTLTGNPDYRIAIVAAVIVGLACGWQYERLT